MERLQNEFDVEVVYRHFPLHPETPEAGQTLEQLFAGRNVDINASKARMVALMKDEGLPYGERTMTYNSRLAQELAAWADTKQNGHAIQDALFRAYFVENINLAKVDNLLAIAAQVELSQDDAKQVLEERSFQAVVDADWQRSRDLGITSVPTFVIGNRGIVGAQPYEQLEGLLIDAKVERRRD